MDNETETSKCTDETEPAAVEAEAETETEVEDNGTDEDKHKHKQKHKHKDKDKDKEKEAASTQENKYSMEKANEDIGQFLSKGIDACSDIPDFVDKYLDLVEEKVSKQEAPKKSKKKSKRGSEIPALDYHDGSFLKAAEQMSNLHKHISSAFKLDSGQGLLINRIGTIRHRVMCYLEYEFRVLLEESRIVEPDRNPEPGEDQADDQSKGESWNFPGYSQEVLVTLNKIGNGMISGGYEFECYEVYMITRRNVIEETLNKLGFEKMSVDDVQKMQWETLEKEIPQWIKAFKECAHVYFSGERKLAETIFSDNPSIANSLFSSLTGALFLQLLTFAEAIAVSKRSTEKLFKFLDVYEALRDSFSTIDGLVPKECAKELRGELTTARNRIGKTMICIFCDLENSIKSDTGKTPVPGGAVHPLTRYTMNYLKYACDEYNDTLEQVFKYHTKMEKADPTSNHHESASHNDEEGQSPFSIHLIRIMDLLDSILETKSKLYKDVALSSIFLMNNGRYMLQKIKASPEFHQAMGDNWYRKRSSELRNHHQSYKRETWMKLLGCFNLEGLQVNGKVTKPALKERFKSFNAMFDEIHKTQSTWVVSDKQMQSELRVSIAGVIIPAYRSFLGRFAGYFSPGRQTEKYIKLQPEDIEACIDELFDGNTASMTKRKT